MASCDIFLAMHQINYTEQALYTDEESAQM